MDSQPKTSRPIVEEGTHDSGPGWTHELHRALLKAGWEDTGGGDYRLRRADIRPDLWVWSPSQDTKGPESNRDRHRWQFDQTAGVSEILFDDFVGVVTYALIETASLP